MMLSDWWQLRRVAASELSAIYRARSDERMRDGCCIDYGAACCRANNKFMRLFVPMCYEGMDGCANAGKPEDRGEWICPRTWFE
jgi:hypothetical protein